MKIRHAINGGLAECSVEEADKFIASGQWVVVKSAPAPRKAAKVEASSKLEG